MPISLSQIPLYYKDGNGNYQRFIAGSDVSGYRTAAAQDVIDAQQDANIGIVQNTNTATQNITKGKYVIWHGALYTASSAIASGATLSSSNLTAVGGGGLNDLVKIKTITSPVTKDSGADISIVVNSGAKRCGIAFVDFEYTPGSTLANWTLLGTISPVPLAQGFATCQNGYQIVFRLNGEIRAVGPTQPSEEQLRFYLIYPCSL